MSSRVPDQLVLAVVEKAMRTRHRITPCPGCQGPRIHSKRRKGSRCFGCGQRWKVSAIVLSERTCDRCGKPITQPWGQSTRCKPCRQEVAREKKTALNRAAYRRKLAPSA